MMEKDSKDSRRKTLLVDVPNQLRRARNVTNDVPYELHDFCDYLASIAQKKNMLPVNMLALVAYGFNHLLQECLDEDKMLYPAELEEEKEQIINYISYFPLIIDRIADKKFAEEFRAIFMQMFRKVDLPPENGRVDISNKDKAEVLVALYNNAYCRKTGILQAKIEPMDINQARKLLKQTTCFEYLTRYALKIGMEENIVDTTEYNLKYGEYAAERIIFRCHNVR